MEELLKIGAAYVRVSDERQDEYSPDSQLKKIREYAAKEGYMIPDEYVFYDDGISGKSVKKRDDFNRMIATAKEKTSPFNRIYVWKFSRFARNQEEAIVYKSLLSKHGVSVVSVSEPIPEGHFGSLIERIIEWTDEYYLANLSGEVIRGMTEKVTRGEPVVPPPFGYKMGEKKYIPDEVEAPIVREMFERYASGEGHRAIAISLGARGVRTRRGNMPDNRFVEFILRNPCYIGKFRWTLDGIRAVSRRDYDNENIMIIDGNHEPLVSMELWEAVQNRSKEQKRMYGKRARREQQVDYMLKGLVRCSSCGATLACASATSGKAKSLTMQCCSYSRGACHTSHSVVIDKANAAIIDGLLTVVQTKRFTIAPREVKKSNNTDIDYDKLIATEVRRLERAREAYLAEIDTLEAYAKNKKEIEARIAYLKAKRDVDAEPQINADDFAKKVMSVVEFIQRDDVTEQAKNEALRSIIEKIVFDRPNGNFAIYFHA